MPIPDYQSIMLPLLKLIAKKGFLGRSEAAELVANEFNLTENERRELLASGKDTIIKNRVGWARTYLKKSGLVTYPQRGLVAITERGKNVLLENPKSINLQYLRRFPEFLAFYSSSTQDNASSPTTDISQATPEETLESAYNQLKNQVIADTIEKIKSCSPRFFETLVVDTIVKMGYGGTLKKATAAVTGHSGDEGIDGIINEDRLGLDVIYLQAKRWESNVGRPEIQKFAGALQGKRAKKGIFITISDFTTEAKEYVRHIESRIILISGQELAELMWEHGIGMQSATIYEVRKMDFDYFNE